MHLSNLKTASQYAKSFLKQAKEAEILEHVYRDVLFLKKVVENNKNLAQVLKSPIITNDKKWSILEILFQARVHKLTLNLLRIVSHAKREAILPTIMDVFLEQYYAYKKIAIARITTTFQLSDDLIDYFKNLVQSLVPCKDVILTEHIDPAIQGGFILRVADRQIDQSLANKLHGLNKKFSIAQY